MKSILIVDDERNLRKLLAITLEHLHITIYEASDGQQAIEMINRYYPTLVILDIMMPGEINGLDVCRHVKSKPELADISVIMLTAMGQKEDYNVGISVGADKYITKPFSPLQLLYEIDFFLLKPKVEQVSLGGLNSVNSDN